MRYAVVVFRFVDYHHQDDDDEDYGTGNGYVEEDKPINPWLRCLLLCAGFSLLAVVVKWGMGHVQWQNPVDDARRTTTTASAHTTNQAKSSGSGEAPTSPANGERSLVVTVQDFTTGQPIPGAKVWCIHCVQSQGRFKTPPHLMTGADGRAIFTPWLPAATETPGGFSSSHYWAQLFVLAPGYYCRGLQPESADDAVVARMQRDTNVTYPVPAGRPLQPVSSMQGLTYAGTFEMDTSKVVTGDPGYELKFLEEYHHVLSPVATGTWDVWHRMGVERLQNKGEGRENGQVLVMHRDQNASTDEKKLAHLARLNWNACTTDTGGDGGVTGIFDEKYFANDSVVPKSFVHPPDFDGLNRWYTWLCQELGNKEIVLVPHGVMLHSEGLTVLEGRDEKGVIQAMLLAE